MKITTLVSVAVAIVASTVSISAAVAAPALPQVKVSYADLNLASAAGKATLELRIRHAAAQVCDVNDTNRQPEMVRERAQCYTAAMNQARVAVASLDQTVVASR